MREERDNRLSKCQGFVSISTDSPCFLSLSVSLYQICLCSHRANHHQTIFQLIARVHVLMCAHVFVYVGYEEIGEKGPFARRLGYTVTGKLRLE